MINEQDHQQQQNGNHLVDQLMKPIQSKSFGDYLIEELYRNNLHLNQYYSDLIRIKLNEYDQFNMRRFEEKDQFINQLKQNLMELTEKRFRQLNAKSSPSSETLTSSHSSSSLIIDSTNALNNNMKFVLNEKDAQISQLLKQLNENELEIDRLKTTIKEQDNIILSHNNNIYELKNNNETVLKAKQESFRLMNDDMQRKQKLIDDQTSVIKNLKEKIEQIEEQHAQSRSDLEKRLNEKENDLLTKIATFESNLLEGRHYFEDILKEKQNELNQLKQQLQKNNDNNNEQHLVTNDSTTNSTNNNENNSISTIQKYDAENLKNIKSLYEHQIDLLKVKIDMLEKTCNNYKKGIKEMNKSFGQQQQTDEMTSMATFKDLMQQMHKTNAQLETERIDLQVKSSKLKEELEQVRIEKENLNRKYLNSDQINQRLQNERIEIDLNFKRNIDLKQNEISHLNNELNSQREENERLRNENEMLIQSLTEYEQLKLNHDQLTQHYEQLYNQASEIVTGNQVLSEQTQAQTLEIHRLNQLIEDYQLKIDHLEHCNSELNTQKINLDMKLVLIENKLAECECDLRELNILRNSKLDVDKLTQLNKDLKLELTEKNELIEQLNQAKDFLAENNSNLLTNNIRIQLFVESMGLELTSLETSSAVNEYDSLRIECKQIQFQLNEMKILNQQLEINQQNYKDLINNKELEIKNLISQINSKEDKVDASEQTDENDLVIKKELEQTRLEMDQFKLKYEETIEKQANLEQLNLKLKAKVKQLLKQPVVATTTINVSTNTDELSKMCSESIQTDEILLNSENLIEFGSKIVANDLNNYVSQRVDDLKNDMTIFLLNNEVKVQNALREALKYKNLLNNLEKENEKLKFYINELKKNEIQTFNNKNNNLSPLDSSDNHQDELDRINQLHSEQLAQFEANFTNLQNENDLLMSKLEKLEKESTNTQSNELESFKSKYEEINQKNLNLEQLNLKYKAKLKQLLKQQQQTNTSSLLVEQRSTNSTPTLSPNPVHSYEQHQCTTETISTQTDLLNIDLLEDLLKTYKSELAVLNSQLEESNLEIENLNKKIEDLNKIETTTHVKMASDQDLQARLESVQQLNLKLKAKLKQQIEKNKTVLDESLVSSTSSSELNNLKQAKLELERILQEKSIQNEKLANDIQNLNQENEMLLNSKLMKIQELEIINQDLNLKNDKLKIDLLILNNEKSKTDQLNFELESNISELKESKTMIHDLEGKNNDLLVRINAKSNEIDQFNAEIQEYQFKIDQLNFELESNTAKNKQNEIIIQDLEDKNNDLLVFTNEKSDEIDQLNLKIQELELLKQDLTLKCEQLSNENAKIDHLNSELEKNIQDLEAKNNQLNISNEYQSKIGQLNSELESNIEKVKQNEITIQELEARNNQLNNDLLVCINEKSDEIEQFITKINQYEAIINDKLFKIQELESLNHNNCLKIKELEHLNQTYQVNIDQLNAEFQFKSNEISSKLLESQEIANNHQKSIDLLLKEKHVLLEENQNSLNTNSLKIKELEHLIQDYQLRIDHLNTELNDLKEEKRKNQSKIDGLNEQLNEFKKIEIVEMTKEKEDLLDLKLKLNENDLLEQSFSNGNSSSMNNSMYSTTSVKSSIQFETQLKHCHEKCETVVEKLNLLKKQNEALNSKIKSFKAKDLNN